MFNKLVQVVPGNDERPSARFDSIITERSTGIARLMPSINGEIKEGWSEFTKVFHFLVVKLVSVDATPNFLGSSCKPSSRSNLEMTSRYVGVIIRTFCGLASGRILRRPRVSSHPRIDGKGSCDASRDIDQTFLNSTTFFSLAKKSLSSGAFDRYKDSNDFKNPKFEAKEIGNPVRNPKRIRPFPISFNTSSQMISQTSTIKTRQSDQIDAMFPRTERAAQVLFDGMVIGFGHVEELELYFYFTITAATGSWVWITFFSLSLSVSLETWSFFLLTVLDLKVLEGPLTGLTGGFKLSRLFYPF